MGGNQRVTDGRLQSRINRIGEQVYTEWAGHLDSGTSVSHLARALPLLARRNVQFMGTSLSGFLVGKLTDEEPSVRRAAATALGEIGSVEPGVVDALITRIREDEDKEVRVAAARSLGSLGPAADTAIPSLIELLETNRGSEAVVAFEELGSFAASAVPELIRLLEDESNLYFAIRAIAGIGSEARSAAPYLVDILERELPWDYLARAAMQALQSMGAKWSYEVSSATEDFEEVEVSKTDTRRVRRYESCTIINDVSTLIAVLGSTSPDDAWVARNRAVMALGAIGPTAAPAVQSIIRVLTNDNEYPTVRREAAWALGQIGPEAAPAVRALADSLQDRDDGDFTTDQLGLPWWVANALGGIGPAAGTAVPELTLALNHRDSPVRAAAAAALGSIGPDAFGAIPELVECLVKSRTWDTEGMVGVAGAIGTIVRNSPQAADIVLKMLCHFSYFTAAQALNEMGDAASIETLLEMFDCESDALRMSAARALERAAADVAQRVFACPDSRLRSALVRLNRAVGLHGRPTLSLIPIADLTSGKRPCKRPKRASQKPPERKSRLRSPQPIAPSNASPVPQPN